MIPLGFMDAESHELNHLATIFEEARRAFIDGQSFQLGLHSAARVLQKHFSGLKTALDQANADKVFAARLNAELTRDFHNASSESGQRAAEITQLKEELAKEKNRVDLHRKTIDRIYSELTHVKNLNENQSEMIRKSWGDRDTLKKMNDAQRHNIEEYQRNIGSLNNELAERKAYAERLKKELVDAELNLGLARKENNLLTQDVAGAKSTFSLYQKTIDRLQGDLNCYKLCPSESNRLQRKLADANAEVDRLKKDLVLMTEGRRVDNEENAERIKRLTGSFLIDRANQAIVDSLAKMIPGSVDSLVHSVVERIGLVGGECFDRGDRVKVERIIRDAFKQLTEDADRKLACARKDLADERAKRQDVTDGIVEFKATVGDVQWTVRDEISHIDRVTATMKRLIKKS